MISAKSCRISFLPAILVLSTIGITSCNLFPKPQLSNLKICEMLNQQGFCQDALNSFQNKNQKLFVSANLQNASSNVPVKVEWVYLPNDGPLAGKEVPITSETIQPKGSDDFVVASISSPSKGWKEGTYKVVITLPESSNSNANVKEFTIAP
jgi:hypothetical protein